MLCFTFTFAHSQQCQEQFHWSDFQGPGLADDLSYTTLKDNPLTIHNQNFNAINDAPFGGIANINHTYYQELLGGIENTYIMSLAGIDENDFIHFKLEFNGQIKDPRFTIVDIDRSINGTWADSILIKTYLNGIQKSFDFNNIISLGQYILFNDNEDSFKGILPELNPTGVRGNVEIQIFGHVDSLVIDYHYGNNADPSNLGSQLIGLSSISFISEDVCQAPQLLNDEFCQEWQSEMCLEVLINDDPGIGNLDLSTLKIIVPPSHGIASISTNGKLIYEPEVGYSGMDNITYEICNNYNLCSQAIVAINVEEPKNILAVYDQFNTLINLDFSANIMINDLMNTSTLVTTTPVIPPNNGSIILSEDGTFNYTPHSGYVGQDFFEYEICEEDSPNICYNAHVLIDIINPFSTDGKSYIPNHDMLITLMNNTVQGDVSLNDYETAISNEDMMIHSLISSPEFGIGSISSTGIIDYAPNLDYSGIDSFKYKVCYENDPLCCSEASIFINVLNEDSDCNQNNIISNHDFNIDCVGVNIFGQVDQNDFVNINQSFYTEHKIISQPEHGIAVIDENGHYSYLPNSNHSGSDYFTYEVCAFSDELTQFSESYKDESTPIFMPMGTLSIASKITFPNDGIVSDINVEDLHILHDNIGELKISLVSPSGTSVLIYDGTCFGYEDLHISFDDASPFGIITCPTDMGNTFKPENTLSVFNGENVKGDWNIIVTDNNPVSSNGTILNWSLRITQSFNKKLTCSQSYVEIVTLPKVHPPVAECDNFDVFAGELNALNVVLNDTDQDGDLSIETVEIINGPNNGLASASSSGEIFYIPNADFMGKDTIEYKICDSFNLCDTAQVKLLISNILPAYDLPIEVLTIDNGHRLIEWNTSFLPDNCTYSLERKYNNVLSVLVHDSNTKTHVDDEKLVSHSELLYRVKALSNQELLYTSKWVSSNVHNETRFYPNPFDLSINFELGREINDHTLKYSILSITGDLIQSGFTSISNNKGSIELVTLDSGIYLLKFDHHLFNDLYKICKY